MKLNDLKQYATDALAEALACSIKGFQDVNEVIGTVDDQEAEFDGDSYCPYYSQQVEVIARYEEEFGDEAEEFCGEATYKAADWQKAQTAYAYAIAYAGYSHYFAAAKDELSEALDEFALDASVELKTDEAIEVRVGTSCAHGWAAHNRELSNGTMIWESGQLDGCNGMEREVGGVWISCCIDQSAKAEN